MTRRTWVPIAALGLGGAVAVAGPALPAVASDLPTHVDIEIIDGARVVAKGAGVIVPVEVICEAGRAGFVSVDVTQARGRFIANGGGSTQFECTGTTQTFEILVTANNGAFKRGTALANAFLASCTDMFSSCQQDSDAEEITLSPS